MWRFFGPKQTPFNAESYRKEPERLAVELRVAGGRSLWLRAGFDPERLQPVLGALEGRR